MILKGFEEERDHIGRKEENNYTRRNKGKKGERNDRHPLTLFSFSPLMAVAKNGPAYS